MNRLVIKISVALLSFAVGSAATMLWSDHPQPVAQRAMPSAAAIVPIACPPAIEKERHTLTFHINGSKYLKAIEFISHDEEHPLYRTSAETILDKTASFNLGLDESVSNQILFLHPLPNESRQFKVEQRYETSMTVMGEGPHVDLLDWKHYVSPWKELSSVGKNQFLTIDTSEDDSRFPKVTKKEMLNAIGDSSWREEVRKCKSPTDYPCAVMISKISLRIKVRDGNTWKVVKTLDLMLAMGC